MRIASFVPAATELVAALGLRPRLVGVTHACPQVVDLEGTQVRVLTRARVPTVGSGGAIDGAVRTALQSRNDVVAFDARQLAELHPDLVILPAARPGGRVPCIVDPNALRGAVTRLPTPPRLVEYGPSRLAELLGSTRALGEVLGRGADAARLVAEWRARVERVRELSSRSARRPRVALLTWIQPPIGAGGLLAELVALAGGLSVTGDPETPSRTSSWEEVAAAEPDVVLLAPCDFVLERACADAAAVLAGDAGALLARTPAARWGQVHALEARRWFSALGPGTVRALEILACLVHPERPWPDGTLPREAWRPISVGA